MGSPRRVYLAARHARKPELLKYKPILESNGYQVTSRWLTLPPMESTGEPEKVHIALMNLEDIRAAATVIVFTEDKPSNPDNGEPSPGVYHTELGLAFSLKKNVVIVGPRENVFHWMPGVVAYPEWETFVKFKGLKV